MPAKFVHVPLGQLDYVPAVAYGSVISYFGMKSGASPAHVFKYLQDGLHRLFLQVPLLSGKLHLRSQDAPDFRPGQLEIRYGPIEANQQTQLRFNEIHSSKSYEQINAEGFPVDIFRDSELIWKPFQPDITEGTEVLIAQANFMPGACLLAFSVHHSVCDATGSALVFKEWGQCCQIANAKESNRVDNIVSNNVSWDRSILHTIWRNEAKDLHPSLKFDSKIWHMVAREPPEAEPTQTILPRAGLRPMSSTVFYLSPSSFSDLHNLCKKELGTPSNVSRNDLLMALIWRALTRARTAKTMEDPDDLTCIAVTVDGRPNFSHSTDVLQNYIGNVVFQHRPTTSLGTIISPESTIASIAKVIRESASVVSHQSMMDAYALLEGIQDYGSRKRVTRHLLFTPMLMIPTGFDFGEDGPFTNGGRPEGYRHMQSQRNEMCLPVCFIMPKRASGGIEVIISLFEGELELLLQDSEFNRYFSFLS
ncbi:hypothetical protein NQ176_g794 [Zarea fungicola]|uniref:Uncharacterized protein n=1 Tax=Zarea fungicola TaxID=93591 RepID=A0ACC1NW43_9HYPO|nr:hypothetical protein NQ176_g794 [Lecanicillium fungicola]